MFEIFIEYFKVFITGGLICGTGQLLIDKTKLTSARILVLFVSLGVVLTLIGLYEKIIQFGGSGATVPLTGFGYALAKGVFTEIDQIGLLGAFSGGLKSVAAGLSAAIIFGYLAAISFKPKAKR